MSVTGCFFWTVLPPSFSMFFNAASMSGTSTVMTVFLTSLLSFYQKVFGWDISKYPGMEYHMVGTTEVDPKTRMPTQPGAINGGLTKRNNEVKNTVITVDVPDIEAALKNIEKLGGKTVQKKQPVTDMGFTAYFKDTEGNIVGL